MENLLKNTTDLTVFNLENNNLTKYLKEQIKEGNNINILIDTETVFKKDMSCTKYLDDSHNIHDNFLNFRYSIKGDSKNIQLEVIDSKQIENFNKGELSENKSFVNESLPRRSVSYIKHLVNTKEYEVYVSVFMTTLKLSINRI